MSTPTPTTPGIAPGGRGAPNVVIDHHPSHPPAYPKALAVIATVAALYFGREIFIPLAVAILLTFALSPLVAALRWIRVPRPAAVIAVVIGAFAAIFMFGAVVASQLGTLAQNIPLYQYNLVSKVEVIKDANVGGGVIERLSKLLERLGREIQAEEEPETVGTAGLRIESFHTATTGGGCHAAAWPNPGFAECRWAANSTPSHRWHHYRGGDLHAFEA